MSNALIVGVAHPRREEDMGDGVGCKEVEGIGEEGTKESAAVSVEPVGVKGGCSKGSSHDCGDG